MNLQSPLFSFFFLSIYSLATPFSKSSFYTSYTSAPPFFHPLHPTKSAMRFAAVIGVCSVVLTGAMSAQAVVAASAKTAPQPAIAEITYPTDAELQERVEVFAQIEEYKTLDLHGKKQQHQQPNKHNHHQKSVKVDHEKKAQSEHHHHHQKRDELAVAHTALGTQDQRQEFQSPEVTLSFLSDLAARFNFDEEGKDAEFKEGEYDKDDEVDEFGGEDDEFEVLDNADDLEALNNGGKKDKKEKDCVVYETITVVPERTVTETAEATAF